MHQKPRQGSCCSATRDRVSLMSKQPSALLAEIAGKLGLPKTALSGGNLAVMSPIDGGELARIRTTSAADLDAAIKAAGEAFRQWRRAPAPHRGALVREL